MSTLGAEALVVSILQCGALQQCLSHLENWERVQVCPPDAGLELISLGGWSLLVALHW